MTHVGTAVCRRARITRATRTAKAGRLEAGSDQAIAHDLTTATRLDERERPEMDRGLPSSRARHLWPDSARPSDSQNEPSSTSSVPRPPMLTPRPRALRRGSACAWLPLAGAL